MSHERHCIMPTFWLNLAIFILKCHMRLSSTFLSLDIVRKKSMVMREIEIRIWLSALSEIYTCFKSPKWFLFGENFRYGTKQNNCGRTVTQLGQRSFLIACDSSSKIFLVSFTC
jgi:hypothetical protein